MPFRHPKIARLAKAPLFVVWASRIANGLGPVSEFGGRGYPAADESCFEI
jgi:hypothetical protein